MLSIPRFTLAVAVNNRRTLEANLLASPALQGRPAVELIIKEDRASAALAYNSALDESQGEFVVFAHQDIYLPALWFKRLEHSIDTLASSGLRWGVLGCFGSRADAFGGVGRVYTHGLGLHGNPIAKPEVVESLDEIVLVLRRSSGLRFDPALPHFHLYGVDISMAARSAGMDNYAIPAFCVHNTNQLLELPPEFYECYAFVKRKWEQYLPIAASCMTISHRDLALRRKKGEEFLARLLRRRLQALKRVDDPRSLLPEDFWRRLESDPGTTPATPLRALHTATRRDDLPNSKPERS